MTVALTRSLASLGESECCSDTRESDLFEPRTETGVDIWHERPLVSAHFQSGHRSLLVHEKMPDNVFENKLVGKQLTSGCLPWLVKVTGVKTTDLMLVIRNPWNALPFLLK